MSLLMYARCHSSRHSLRYLFDVLKENPNCLLIVTPQGGHLGWVAGDEIPFGAPWTDHVVMEFLEYVNEENVQKAEAGQFDELDASQQSPSSVSIRVQ